VNLVWTVPVVAAAIATALAAARARSLEDATIDLAHEVRRLREVKPSLTAVRSALQGTRQRGADFRRRHPLAPDRDTG
jgi:uncharacterized protein involved in exopolysaccharide biosynthesis